MHQYHDLLRRILREGVRKTDRTGTGTISVFGHQARYDLSHGFPLLTTKKMHLKSIIYELLWFLRGESNIKYLVDHNVHIWDEWPFDRYLTAQNLQDQYPRYSRIWHQELKKFIHQVKYDESFAQEWGDLGPVYGTQWRHWPTPDGGEIDQIKQLLTQIHTKPDSRRLIVSAWNVAEVDQMALPPCHSLFQFYIADGKLSLQLYQRSADVFLGVPFNIASYALLLMMIAQVTGYAPGEFVHTTGDTHIYLNHLEQVKIQLSRDPRPLPLMKINPDIKDLFGFEYSDFQLLGYHPHPRITAPIAV